MNILSLFDGMGCGQLALKKAGIKYEKYFASEIDKYAIQVTQHNFPNTIQLGDITKIDTSILPKIDLILAGSPCQGFSIAGKQLAFDDPRSKLFFEFIRILKELKPKYFLLENVKMKKEYKNLITKFVGYDPIEINSSLVSAQNRKRLYWTNIPNITLPSDKGILLKDIVETAVSPKYTLSNKLLEGFERKRIRRKHLKSGFDNFNVRELSGKSSTLTARYFKTSMSDPYIKNTDGTYRRFTPLECERLQTVPDNYTDTVSDTQRYKMLGNGWTVDVIAHIFKNIK